MRHLVVFIALIATTVIASRANTTQNVATPTVSVVQRPTVIQKGPALVKSRIPKPKLFRANPHRVAHFALIDDQDDIFVADDDLATGYRRRDLGKIEKDKEAPLPEHIRWRLFLARTAAMLKYKEIHG